jgi:hypothetical protein
MTVFMAFAILGSFATIALLWCFMGFSRELKRGRKTVGVVVRVMDTDAKHPARNQPRGNKGSVIEMPRSQPQLLQTGANRDTRVSKA